MIEVSQSVYEEALRSTTLADITPFAVEGALWYSKNTSTQPYWEVIAIKWAGVYRLSTSYFEQWLTVEGFDCSMSELFILPCLGDGEHYSLVGDIGVWAAKASTLKQL